MRKLQQFDKDGQRVRYFGDDDAADLATLVKRARHGDDAHDLDADVARGIMNAKQYKARSPLALHQDAVS